MNEISRVRKSFQCASTNGSIRFIITSRVVSLIMVFLPSPSQLKEMLDKEALSPLFCLLWF